MRVLHIDTQMTWRGGEQQIFYIAEGQIARGVEAHVVHQPGSALGDRCKEAGIPGIALRMRNEVDFFAAHKVKKITNDGAFDFIHVHTSHAHAIGFWAAKMGAESKVIVHRHVDYVPKSHIFSRTKYRYPKLHFIAVSDAIKRILIASGVEAHRIDTVHNGIQVQRIQKAAQRNLRNEWGVSAERLVIGNTGSLVEQKDQSTLIKALAKVVKKHPEVIAVIVGSGHLEEALKTEIKELKLQSNVLMAGFRSDIPDCLNSFDLYAQSSIAEGLPISVLEAMSVGLPVVATDVGGVVEAISQGETGYTVPARDPGALANKIVCLIEDPDKAKALGANAKRRAEEQFTSDDMVEGVMAVYEKCLAS